MPAVSERVDRLEDIVAQTSLELRASAARADVRMERFEREMREFKNEMREFKNEMRAASAAADARMERFEQEMREFKDEMRGFKDEMGNFKREVRKDLGESANRMGRLVEDMVYPGIPKVFREITGLKEEQIDFAGIRIKKIRPRRREFDAVIDGGGYVLINETKATLRPEYVNDFYALMRDDIRLYFPEYPDKKFIGIVSSLYADDSIIALGVNLGFFVLGFGNDLLDVLNPPGFEPRYF